MKKKNKPEEKYEPKAAGELKSTLSSFNWNKAGLLALFTIIALVVYYYLNIYHGAYAAYIVGFYVIAAAVLIVAYFIYNRAFTGRGVTYEMLPDTMTDEEKKEYLNDVARRERKSRWMLMIIFPLIITLMVDMVKLFIIDKYFDFKLF